MSAGSIILFGTAGAMAAEWALIRRCFGAGSARLRGAKRWRGPLVFVGLHVAVFFSLLAGGYAQEKWNYLADARHMIGHCFKEHGSATPETFHATGDPGMIEHISRQTPAVGRPDMASGASLRDWQDRLRPQLLELFGLDLESEVDVAHELQSTEQLESGVRRTFLVYESFDGTKIPAYLFVPSVEQPKGAVLVLHGHVGCPHEEGITQTAGLIESYHNGAARALAEAGYVTLTIEFRGFGYLGRREELEHRFVAYNAILSGSFYKALLCKDIHYAYELLRSLELVEPERIGITGVSFGGEMAVTYAALDERIVAVVVQGAMGEVGPVPGKLGSQVTEQPHYCHIVPGHNKYLHREDWLLLVAPRPMLGVRGSLKKWGPDQRQAVEPPAIDVVKKAYEAFDAARSFDFRIEGGKHEYFVEPALAFFEYGLAGSALQDDTVASVSEGGGR